MGQMSRRTIQLQITVNVLTPEVTDAVFDKMTAEVLDQAQRTVFSYLKKHDNVEAFTMVPFDSHADILESEQHERRVRVLENGRATVRVVDQDHPIE